MASVHDVSVEARVSSFRLAEPESEQLPSVNGGRDL